MALFTSLEPDAIARIAAGFGLGAVRSAEPLWAGTVNSNFRLETDAGVYFLRVNEGKTEDDVAYEAALLDHLAARGVATPRPAHTEAGVPYACDRGHLVTLFPWVAGEHRDARTARAADLTQLGAALAVCHAAGVDFPRRRTSRYAFDRIVERWHTVAQAAPPAPAWVVAALAEVAAETEWLSAPSRTAVRSRLPVGVIHGDLFPDNVLFEGDRLTALLDFEQASDGAWTYDLAVCLCSWCFADDFQHSRVRALVAGYQTVRQLTLDERLGLYVEARAAAMRFTVTRITDVELNPDASAMTRQTKDFRRFLARLRALQAWGEERFVGEVLGGRTA